MPRSFLVRKPSDPRRKPNYSELQDACVGAWRGAGRGQLGMGGILRARRGESGSAGATGGSGAPGLGSWGPPRAFVARDGEAPLSEDLKAGSLSESGWGRGGRGASPGAPRIGSADPLLSLLLPQSSPSSSPTTRPTCWPPSLRPRSSTPPLRCPPSSGTLSWCPKFSRLPGPPFRCGRAPGPQS